MAPGSIIDLPDLPIHPLDMALLPGIRAAISSLAYAFVPGTTAQPVSVSAAD